MNHMARCRLALILVLAEIVFPYSSHAGDESDPVVLLEGELATFNLAHPERDAAKAIASGAPRCYAIAGFVISIPGVRNKAEAEFCRPLSQVIAGTSDAVRGEHHKKLIDQATRYAIKYNGYILQHSHRAHTGTSANGALPAAPAGLSS